MADKKYYGHLRRDRKFYKHVGERIRIGRIAMQLTQKELTEKLGYKNRQTISGWERSVVEISLFDYLRVTQVLGIERALNWTYSINREVAA